MVKKIIWFCFFVVLGFLSPSGRAATVYVSNGSVIGSYDTSGTPINPALITGLKGYVEEIAIYDSHIYVLQYHTGTLSKYKLDGTLVTANLISGLAHPLSFAIAEGFIYVTTQDNHRIGKYSLTGAPVNTALVTGLNNPTGIAISDSMIYVANNWGNTIGKYSLTGAVVNASLITGIADPVDIAVMGDTLYVTDQFNYRIGKYTTSGSVINANLIPMPNLTHRVGLLGDELYFSTDRNQIHRYDTSGKLLQAAVFTGDVFAIHNVVVPLPAAAWQGIATLSMMGCYVIFMKRRRRVNVAYS